MTPGCGGHQTDRIPSVTPGIAASVTQSVALPQPTNRASDGQVSSIDGGSLQFLAYPQFKYWEIVKSLFSNQATRNRNLYIATCALINATTDLRWQIMTNPSHSLLRMLQSLQNDCGASMLSIPSWYSHPARAYAHGETSPDHSQRLSTLLVRAG
jgi:hypothetical protein